MRFAFPPHHAENAHLYAVHTRHGYPAYLSGATLCGALRELPCAPSPHQ